ncbi:hypothetical protein ACI09J_001788 [Cronobacter turicensis]
MHSENNELVKAGHELAKCLDNEPLLDIAKMIVRLADKLDVTTAALREKTKQCEQIAEAVAWVEGGNFTLAEAVAGHVSGLKAAAQRSEELAAENAALKSCAEFYSTGFIPVTGKFGLEWRPTEKLLNDCGNTASNAIPTPVTDAFLREVRAQGAENAAAYIKISIQHLPEDHRVAYHDAIELCSGAADKLRKGGAA